MSRGDHAVDFNPDEWDEIRDRFADPGGDSSLRRATRNDPRNKPCPICKQPNRLTRADVAEGYQCDTCADKAEAGIEGY